MSSVLDEKNERVLTDDTEDGRDCRAFEAEDRLRVIPDAGRKASDDVEAAAAAAAARGTWTRRREEGNAAAAKTAIIT
jgi:hypothetical protein